jgi:CRP-like cAMP-binding protein
MSDLELIRHLAAIPLFADLGEDALGRVAAMATEFEVPAGHVLLERGQPGSGLFCIVEGAVTVEIPTGPVELGPGEFVGELSLLADGISHVARVRAATPVRGIAIGRAAFADLLEREPRVAVTMLPVLARRLADVETPGPG